MDTKAAAVTLDGESYFNNCYHITNCRHSVLEKMLTDQTEGLVFCDIGGELIAEPAEIDYGLNRYGSMASALAHQFGFIL